MCHLHSSIAQERNSWLLHRVVLRQAHRRPTCYDHCFVLGPRNCQLQSVTVPSFGLSRPLMNFLTGRFLRLILKDLGSWLNSETYMSEQATATGVFLPGLVKKITSLGKSKFEQSDLLSSHEIGSFVQKLHKKILKVCLTAFPTRHVSTRSSPRRLP